MQQSHNTYKNNILVLSKILFHKNADLLDIRNTRVGTNGKEREEKNFYHFLIQQNFSEGGFRPEEAPKNRLNCAACKLIGGARRSHKSQHMLVCGHGGTVNSCL